MRIGHVNLASGFGGGEVQTLKLASELRKLGHDNIIICKPNSPLFNASKTQGYQTLTCAHFLLSHKNAKRLNCDVFHAHEAKSIYWCFLHKKLFKAPYIITRRNQPQPKKKRLLKAAYSNASKVVALSRAISDAISSAFSNISAHIIPDSPVNYAIEKDRLALTAKLTDRGTFKVIQAGMLAAHKGFNLTIEAARALETSHPNLHFYLLGKGPDEAELKESAKDLNNLTFVGHQTHMAEWFALADLLVHPSNFEGLGSVILEANAAGLPAVGSNAGGIPDAIQHEYSGLLFEKGNAGALAESIIRIYESPTLLQTLANNAKEHIKHFDISVCAKQYVALYSSALET